MYIHVHVHVHVYIVNAVPGIAITVAGKPYAQVRSLHVYVHYEY